MVFIRIVSLVAALVLLSITLSVEAAALEHDYNIKPVPFNKVDVHDHFWTPRLQTNQNVTIPYAFWECEQTDRISNFEKAAGLIEGEHEGLYFNDS
ncbi:MAG: glycoside hydrolase family 127 protein, partial [Planctomycetota bacterium]